MTKAYTAPQAFSEEARPLISLKPVESSQIAAIGYDEPTKTLAIAFTRGTGAIYHYPNVEKATYDAFMESESVGTFFGQHIKSLPFSKYAADPVVEDKVASA